MGSEFKKEKQVRKGTNWEMKNNGEAVRISIEGKTVYSGVQKLRYLDWIRQQTSSDPTSIAKAHVFQLQVPTVHAA